MSLLLLRLIICIIQSPCICVCTCVRACACACVSSRSPSENSPALSPHLSSSPRARSSNNQLLDVGWPPADRGSGGSWSMVTSPHPSTSSEVDSVLAVPHAGHRDVSEQLDRTREISQLCGKQSIVNVARFLYAHFSKSDRFSRKL